MGIALFNPANERCDTDTSTRAHIAGSATFPALPAFNIQAQLSWSGAVVAPGFAVVVYLGEIFAARSCTEENGWTFVGNTWEDEQFCIEHAPTVSVVELDELGKCVCVMQTK